MLRRVMREITQPRRKTGFFRGFDVAARYNFFAQSEDTAAEEMEKCRNSSA
jgi:hypothetical protein